MATLFLNLSDFVIPMTNNFNLNCLFDFTHKLPSIIFDFEVFEVLKSKLLFVDSYFMQ
jgi:hypothetical protein